MIIIVRQSGIDVFTIGAASPPIIASTQSCSPAANIEGWRSFAPSRNPVSSQLRSPLRYQLTPPRKPARLNSPAKNSRSASVSHGGNFFGATPDSMNLLLRGNTNCQRSDGGGSPDRE